MKPENTSRIVKSFDGTPIGWLETIFKAPTAEDPRATGTPAERHSLAMDLAAQAMRSDNPEEAGMLYAHAHGIEKEIAENIPANKENEPSRSIMYRSAASLANNAGFYTNAKELALEGLGGYPPSCVAQELFDVYLEAIKPR